MKDIPDGSIDMILCDLPYGVTKNSWDSVIDLTELWKQYNRITKENAAIVLFGQDKFSARLMLSNEKYHRYNLIWQKTSPTGFLNANKMPLRAHEDILVFYRKPPVYNPQKTSGHERKVSLQKHKVNSVKTTNYGEHEMKSYDSTERFPTSVLRFKTDKQKSSLHPTQKPVSLLECLIKTYTNVGYTVLDNAAGSGSTGVACENTNRNYILIEKEQKYIDIINNRLAIETY
jgi:site-specific DNA-methyltransferase (adenine-specific)